MADKLTDSAVYGNPSRVALRAGGRIHLQSLPIEPIRIPEDFAHVYLRPRIDSELPEAVSTHFRPALSAHGFDRTYTGLVEMARNAFQHGNDRTPGSEVRISYRINNYCFKAFVEDEGLKPTHPEFFSFIDRTQTFIQDANIATPAQRNRVLSNAERFYGHAQEPIPEGHGGLGTLIAHSVFDKVDYFMSAELNGLAVRLQAKNT